MMLLAELATLLAILGVGVVYGTDVFCALVQRPALTRVDDAVLTAVMGNIHRYGDRRMPVPGVIGLIASAAADEHRTPADARALQDGWDGIIVLRATLRGLAVLVLGTTLIAG